MKDNNKIKLAIVIFIVIVFMTYNFSNWMVDVKYKQSSMLSDKVAKLEQKYPEDKDITEIKNDLEFVNAVCFEGG